MINVVFIDGIIYHNIDRTQRDASHQTMILRFSFR